MELHDRLDMKERSRAMTYLVKTKWWKLLEEFIREKKLDLVKKICLKAWVKNWTRVWLTEQEVDQYRKELVDIDWIMSIPHWYINDAVEQQPDETLWDDVLDNVLSENVL